MLQPRAMNLNSVVEDMSKLIPRLIGEDIEIVIKFAPDLGYIRIDATQFEQVFVNLVLNACDSMPNGGKIRI